MTVALALAPARPGPWPGRTVDARARMEVVLDGSEVSNRFVRWTAAVAVLLSICLPLTTLALAFSGIGPGAVVPAVVGTALYLPIHVWLVWCTARGSRPARAGWLLVAEALVIIAATPLTGVPWLPVYGSLGLAALIVLRPPWSVLAFAALLVAQFPLAAAFGSPGEGVLGALLASKALAVYALLWLLAAVRQLNSTRALLATEAVLQERLRIDDELRRTVGADLQEITALGARASSAVDAADAEERLRRLVGRSRLTLSRARLMISGYQRLSLRTELDTAASLLRAAGITTHVVAPAELPDTADEARAQLRAATARLLRDGSAAGCRITVTVDGGRVDLGVQSNSRAADTARAGAA